MSGIRAGRVFALVGLAIAAALLIGPARAGAAKYAVAQCGWHVGNDADWSDSAGGQKFRPDSYCVTPPGADPFDGTHMKSFTVESAGTVSGTRFARWRWVLPPARGSSTCARPGGTRSATGSSTGSAPEPATAASTSSPPPRPLTRRRRSFAVGSPTPAGAREQAALRPPRDLHCDLGPQSFSAVRALTITLQDDLAPRPAVAGELIQPGWQRGARTLLFGATDSGSGLRFGETIGRRGPRRAHGARLREGDDRRRVAGHTDAALLHHRLRRVTRSRRRSSPTARTRCSTALRTSPATAAARPRAAADRQQRPRVAPPAGAGRRRGLAPRQRLRRSLGQPRPGRRVTDRRGLLPGDRSRAAMTAASGCSPGRALRRWRT